MSCADLDILLLGDTDRAEFQPARQTLDALGRVHALADVQTAADAIAGSQAAADVIVVAQAYPGQFPQAAIDRLRRAAPLARMVALLGSWCEGEMRSGKPWPGVIRLYWHQAPDRCGRELRRLVEGRGSTWRLPITATEEERLLAAAQTPLSRRQGVIAIYARLAAMESWLAALCRRCGYATVWQRGPHYAQVQGATAAIYDGADLGGGETEQLRRIAAELAPAPLVVLLDFPRIEDHRRALAAGAAGVLAKPLLLDDLLGQLERADALRTAR
jgi:DNA-binding NarL/FixJ family response regulator